MQRTKYDYRLPQFQWMNAEIAKFKDNNTDITLAQWSSFLNWVIDELKTRFDFRIIMDNTNHIVDTIDIPAEGQVNYTHSTVMS